MSLCAEFRFVLLAGSIGVFASQCSTTPKAPVKSTAEINEGRTVPDAPGEAGETAPKPDQPGADPSVPVKAGSDKTAAAPAADAASGDLLANEFVNVRSGPGMKFEIIRTLNKGAKVTGLGKENEIWTKIGEGEYVASRFLSPSAPSQ